MANKLEYAWADFSPEDKRALRALQPVFVLAPRELSEARLKQLVKVLLPQANVVLGIAEESYVAGFEDQPQFRTLRPVATTTLVEKVAAAKTGRHLVTLTYPQAAVDDVLRKLKPHKVLVVRGSYQYVFHRRSTWHVLQELNIPFEYISPFCDEAEARAYEKTLSLELEQRLPDVSPNKSSATDMLRLASAVGEFSYDYSYQTGCVVAEKTPDGYRPVLMTFNAVIPYQTYAMCHGNSREEHLSPAHDTNHYDTIHAEMNALVTATKTGQSLQGKTLFIPLMPCPNCARTLSQSGLGEVVYSIDHSDAYAAELFKKCRIITRKVAVSEVKKPKEPRND